MKLLELFKTKYTEEETAVIKIVDTLLENELSTVQVDPFNMDMFVLLDNKKVLIESRKVSLVEDNRILVLFFHYKDIPTLLKSKVAKRASKDRSMLKSTITALGKDFVNNFI